MEINEDFVSLAEFRTKEDELFSILDAGIKKQVSIYAMANTSQLIPLESPQLLVIKAAYPDKAKLELLHDVSTHSGIVTYKNTINSYVYAYSDLWITKHDVDLVFQKPPITSAAFETERKTLLKLILGMARAAYDYAPGKKNNSTGSKPGSIKSDLALFGLSIDEKTVRYYLKEAAAEHPTKDPREEKETA